MPNIAKNLKNLRHSIYKVGDVCRHPIPKWAATLLAAGNHSLMASLVPLATYDGSGQACHPTVASFQGKTYMVCTPYPYGVEFYENPCIYTRAANCRDWQPLPGSFPIVRPKQLGLEHYSDPCLFRQGDALTLIFRKCERWPAGKTDQLYVTSTNNGTDWSVPRLLAKGKGDSLISPAVGDDAKELFCVEYDEAVDSRLVRYAFRDTAALGEKSVCKLSGLEEGFFVWHIDVSYKPDGSIHGLFMLRKKCAEMVSKLALFSYIPDVNTWHCERDLPLTEDEQKTIQYIYKSALTERSDHILCSACDQKNRYFLFEKSL